MCPLLEMGERDSPLHPMKLKVKGRVGGGSLLKIFQNIITLKLISSFNTCQNIIFQKSWYKNRPITL
jgi:hypothetical protein